MVVNLYSVKNKSLIQFLLLSKSQICAQRKHPWPCTSPFGHVKNWVSILFVSWPKPGWFNTITMLLKFTQINPFYGKWSVVHYILCHYI